MKSSLGFDIDDNELTAPPVRKSSLGFDITQNDLEPTSVFPTPQPEPPKPGLLDRIGSAVKTGIDTATQWGRNAISTPEAPRTGIDTTPPAEAVDANKIIENAPTPASIWGGIKTGINTVARRTAENLVYKPLEAYGKQTGSKPMEEFGAGGQEFLKENPEYYTKEAAEAPFSIAKGAYEGVTRELPSLAGQAAEFIGNKTGITPVEKAGKAVSDWAEEGMKASDEEMKAKGLTQQVLYEGAKMIGPSWGANILGRGVAKGITLIPRIAKALTAAETAAKVAETAGDLETAAKWVAKADKIRSRAETAGSLVSMGGLFGAGQAQQTKDAALKRADDMEKEGDLEGARIMRKEADGWAPVLNGFIETMGEHWGNKYLGKLLWLNENAPMTLGGLFKSLAVEMSTEWGQQFGEASVEKLYNIRPDADPLGEANQVLGPTAVMTLLSAVGGKAIEHLYQKANTSRIGIDTGDNIQEQIKAGIKQPEPTAPTEEAPVAPKQDIEINDITHDDMEDLTKLRDQAVKDGDQTAIDVLQAEIDRLTEEKQAKESTPVLDGEDINQEIKDGLNKEEEGNAEGIRGDEGQIRTGGQEGQPEIQPSPVESGGNLQQPAPEQPSVEPPGKEEEVTGIDTAANEAATSPQNNLPEPTDAQIEAGNYKKGHVNIQGLDISVENPKGSTRKGVSPEGAAWESEVKSHYGYIKGTVGKDKDHIDTFVGDNPASDKVFVVNQINPKTGEFDEHKVMLGFNNMEDANLAYHDNYEPGWRGMGGIVEMSMDQFKTWLKEGNTKKEVEEPAPQQTPEEALGDLDEIFGAKEKQPHEMTRQEFQDKIRSLVGGKEHKEKKPETWDQWLRDIGYRPEDKDTGYSRHKEIVQEALAQGKQISPEVLEDYPDLAKGAGQATSTDAHKKMFGDLIQKYRSFTMETGNYEKIAKPLDDLERLVSDDDIREQVQMHGAPKDIDEIKTKWNWAIRREQGVTYGPLEALLSFGEGGRKKLGAITGIEPIPNAPLEYHVGYEYGPEHPRAIAFNTRMQLKQALGKHFASIKAAITGGRGVQRTLDEEEIAAIEKAGWTTKQVHQMFTKPSEGVIPPGGQLLPAHPVLKSPTRYLPDSNEKEDIITAPMLAKLNELIATNPDVVSKKVGTVDTWFVIKHGKDEIRFSEDGQITSFLTDGIVETQSTIGRTKIQAFINALAKKKGVAVEPTEPTEPRPQDLTGAELENARVQLMRLINKIEKAPQTGLKAEDKKQNAKALEEAKKKLAKLKPGSLTMKGAIDSGFGSYTGDIMQKPVVKVWIAGADEYIKENPDNPEAAYKDYVESAVGEGERELTLEFFKRRSEELSKESLLEDKEPQVPEWAIDTYKNDSDEHLRGLLARWEKANKERMEDLKKLKPKTHEYNELADDIETYNVHMNTLRAELARREYVLKKTLNPKVTKLVRALQANGINTTMSGDLYGNELVYVDVARDAAEELDAAKLPEGWVFTSTDIHITARDVLGRPIPEALKAVTANIEKNALDKRRLAKAGDSVSEEEIDQIVAAFKKKAEGPVKLDVKALFDVVLDKKIKEYEAEVAKGPESAGYKNAVSTLADLKAEKERRGKLKEEKPAKPKVATKGRVTSLIAWINDKGGINLGNWTGEFKEVTEHNPKAKFIKRSGPKTWGIDQLAQMAFDEHLIKDNHPETLFEALKDRNWKAPESAEEVAGEGQYGIINTKEQQENEQRILRSAREEGHASLIESAEAVTRGYAETGEGPNEPRNYKEIQENEVKALTKWAEDNSLLIPSEPFTLAHKEQDNPPLQGAENQVFFDTDRTVIKRKIIWPQETYGDYLRRLQIHNSLGGAKYELMGFSVVPDAKGQERFMPVVRQPFVVGRPATFEEIDAYMHKAGYKGEGGLYRDDFSGIVVWDVSEMNALVDKKGNVVLIDPRIDTEEEYNRKFKTGQIIPETSRFANHYRSGVNSMPALQGYINAGVPVGTVAAEITAEMKPALIEYSQTGGRIFVDSGAFTAFTKGKEVDWEKIIGIYHGLLEAGGKAENFTFVAPDVIGNQEQTFEIQEQYAGRIRALVKKGAKVVVPIQKGALKPYEAWNKSVEEIFKINAEQAIAGIPSNAKAFSKEDIENLIGYPASFHAHVPAIHLLGISPKSTRYDELVNTIEDIDARIEIYSDSNRLRALAGEGRPITNAQQDIEADIETETQLADLTPDAIEQFINLTEGYLSDETKEGLRKFAAGEIEAEDIPGMEDWYADPMLYDAFLKAVKNMTGKTIRQLAVEQTAHEEKFTRRQWYYDKVGRKILYVHDTTNKTHLFTISGNGEFYEVPFDKADEMVRGVVPDSALTEAEKAVKYATGKGKESPRQKAIGAITLGKVEKIEAKGYEIVYGELKKGSDLYYEVVGAYPPAGDRFIERGLTIRKKTTVQPTNLTELAGHIKEIFDAGTPMINKIMARKAIADKIGLKVPELIDKFTEKQLEEAYEYALVQKAREIVTDKALSDDEKWKGIVDLYGKQINLSTRTSTSIQNQAYSTPGPIAYLMGKAVGITDDMTVYDPTAGTGFLLIGANPENTIANELDKTRLEILKDQGIKTVTDHDASQYYPGFPNKTVDRVMTNPPFGALKAPTKAEGYRLTKLEHVIVVKALEKMKDDGKAAIIIGGHNYKNGEMTGTDRIFLNWLYGAYNVRANIDINGDVYSKQGTKYPIRLIIVDGRKAKPNEEYAPKESDILKAHSLDEIKKLVDNIPEKTTIKVGGESERPENISGETGEGLQGEGGKAGAGGRPSGNRPGGKPKTGGRGGANIPKTERPGEHPGAGEKPETPGNKGAGPLGPDVGERDAGDLGLIDADAFDAFLEKAKAKKAQQAGGQQSQAAKDALSDLDDVFGVEEEPTKYEAGVDPAIYAKIKPKLQIVYNDMTSKGKKLDDFVEFFLDRYGEKAFPYLKQFHREAMAEAKKTKETPKEKKTEFKDNEFQIEYKPRSSNPEGASTVIPINMSSAVAKALEDLEKEFGSVDAFVKDKLKYKSDKEMFKALAAEQIDAVALAIKHMDDSSGMIVGDMTGVGKGRVAAAIIRYANILGHKPIFLSKDPKLFSDMYGDLADIGHKPRIFLMHSDGAKASIRNQDNEVIIKAQGSTALYQKMENDLDSVMKDYDVLFSVYSQFQRTNVQMRVLSALARENIVILDESHLASGESTRGNFIRTMIADAKSVLYMSATYAKRPDTMPLYFRTAIGDGGMDINALTQAVLNGGVPLQQYVAGVLAKTGQYIRRELSFEGIAFRASIDEENKDRDSERADRATEILRAIVAFDKLKQGIVADLNDLAVAEGQHITGQEHTSAGVTTSNFASVVHNFVGQLLFALKADRVIAAAIEAHTKGEKPVITLMNTMESFLKDVMEATGTTIGGPIDDNFKGVLEKALRGTLKIKESDAHGNDTTRYLTEEELARLPEAYAAYQNVKALIAAFNVPVPASPIDYIKYNLEKAGIRVTEITGRSLFVDYSGKVPVIAQRSAREIKDRNRPVNDFNAGRVDAMILNAAGSTGLSLHAAEKFADNKPRHMIVLQPDLNIDTFIQTLGRINRRGQVVLPIYTLLQTALPSEKRPALVLMKKMASLNANTSANADSATSLKEIPDMLNHHGDNIAGQYLLQGDQEILHAMEIDNLTPDTDDLLRKFTGKAALLPVEMQEEVYSTLEENYINLIEYLDQIGENDLVAKSHDYDAKVVEKYEVFKGEGQSPFTQSSYLEKLSVKMLKRPFTLAKLRELVDKALESKTATERANEITNELKAATKKYVEDATAKIMATGSDHAAVTSSMLQTKTSEAYNLVSDAINNFKIGSTWEVEVTKGYKTTGTVLGYRIAKGKTGNPSAPSRVRIVFAVVDPIQTIEIPLSREISVRHLSDSPIDNWDELTPHEAREIKYAVTGNILRGYEMLKRRAELVSFQDNKGKYHFGIILPKSMKKEEIKALYGAQTAGIEDAVQHLTQTTLSTPVATTNLLVLMVRLQSGNIMVQVPKSKMVGGKYYLHARLRSLVKNGEFSSRGDYMKAFIMPDNVRPFLQVLADEFNQKFRIQKQLPNLAEGEGDFMGVEAKKAKYKEQGDMFGAAFDQAALTHPLVSSGEMNVNDLPLFRAAEDAQREEARKQDAERQGVLLDQKEPVAPKGWETDLIKAREYATALGLNRSQELEGWNDLLKIEAAIRVELNRRSNINKGKGYLLPENLSDEDLEWAIQSVEDNAKHFEREKKKDPLLAEMSRYELRGLLAERDKRQYHKEAVAEAERRTRDTYVPTEEEYKKAIDSMLSQIKAYRHAPEALANRGFGITEFYAHAIVDNAWQNWPQEVVDAFHDKWKKIYKSDIKLGEIPETDEWGKPFARHIERYQKERTESPLLNRIADFPYNQKPEPFRLSERQGAYEYAKPFYSQLKKVVSEQLPNLFTVKKLKEILNDPKNAIKPEEIQDSGLLAAFDSRTEEVIKVKEKNGRVREYNGEADYSKHLLGELELITTKVPSLINKQEALEYLAKVDKTEVRDAILGANVGLERKLKRLELDARRKLRNVGIPPTEAIGIVEEIKSASSAGLNFHTPYEYISEEKIGDALGDLWNEIHDVISDLRENDGNTVHFRQYSEGGSIEGSYREQFVIAKELDYTPMWGAGYKTTLMREGRHKTNAVVWETEDGRARITWYADIDKYVVDSPEVQNAHTGSLDRAMKIYSEGMIAFEKRYPNAPKRTENWSDGHSAYSDIPNPIVRIRYNDRALPDGSIARYIEELQGPNPENEKKMPEIYRKYRYQIGLKRILRGIAEENKERRKEHRPLITRLSWTTGKIQTDRYSLAKVIDGLIVRLTPDREHAALLVHRIGTHEGEWEKVQRNVPLTDLGKYVPKELVEKVEKGKREADQAEANRKQVHKDYIKYNEEYDAMRLKLLDKYGYPRSIDGDLALRFYHEGLMGGMSTPQERMEAVRYKELGHKSIEARERLNDIAEKATDIKVLGTELEIGGEGLKRLYNDTIPKFLEKYLGQWGAKVVDSELNDTKYKVSEAKTGTVHGFKSFTTLPAAQNLADRLNATRPTQHWTVVEEKGRLHGTQDIRIPQEFQDKILGEGQAIFAPQESYGKLLTDQHRGFANDKQSLAIAAKAIEETAQLEMFGEQPDIRGTRRTAISTARPILPERTISGVRTIGNGITAELIEKGRIDLRGRKADNTRAVATIAQIFRNPQYETLRIIYTKNGMIVGHEGTTSRIPGAAIVFFDKEDFKRRIVEINDRANRLGADGIWLVHNHPTGKPEPSSHDITLTTQMAQTVTVFTGEDQVKITLPIKGHVIVNSGKYASIKPNGKHTMHDINTNDAILKASVPHQLVGMRIASPDNIATYGKIVQKPDYLTAFYVGSDLRIRGIQDVPAKLFSSARHASDFFRGQALSFGSQRVLIAYPDMNMDYNYLHNIDKLIETESITDAVGLVKNGGYISRRRMVNVLENRRAWMGKGISRYRVAEKEERYQARPSSLRLKVPASRFKEILQDVLRIAAKGSKAEIVRRIEVDAEDYAQAIQKWGKGQMNAPLLVTGTHRTVTLNGNDFVSIIQLSERLMDLGTPYHEAFHSVQRLLLTDKEMAVLNAAYPEKAGVSGLERQAQAFGEWVVNNKKNVPPRVHIIFNKISKFFESVRNWLTGKGYKSADDIFESAWTGELAERGVQGGQDTYEGEDRNISFSIRKRPEPKKTLKVYKLLRMKKATPGKLYPLFIDNNNHTPVGVWLDADYIPTKGYAERPGWHFGALPIAPHLMKKDGTMPADRAWVYAEAAADINWQDEANLAGGDIKRRVPFDGYYRYERPALQGKEWIISGAMKIHSVLTDEQVMAILAEHGLTPPVREGGRLDLAKWGLSQYAAKDIRPIKEETSFQIAEPEEQYNFNPENPEPTLRQSMNYHLSNWLDSDKTFGWWHKTVSTQYHKAQIDRHFKKVYDLGQDYLTDFSRIAMDAEDKAPTLLSKVTRARDLLQFGIGKADSEAVGGRIFAGTLEDRIYDDDELRAEGLTDRQIELYRQYRAAVDQSIDDLAKSTISKLAYAEGVPHEWVRANRDFPLMQYTQELYDEYFKPVRDDLKADILALQERLKMLDMETMKDEEYAAERKFVEGELSNAMTKLKALDQTITNIYKTQARANKLKNEGYAPLMRFGKHTVYVYDRDLTTGKQEQIFFGLYESQIAANKAAKILQQEYPEATVEKGILSTEAFRLYNGLTPDVVELFARETGLDKDPLFQEYYKRALNNRSAMKRLIHRKGIPGFSEDTTRTLAQFVVSNSRLASTNYNMGEMRKAIESIPRAKGDVKDESIRLWDYLTNPKEEAANLRGFLFFNYLGGSLASGFVNATQPVLMTAPYLSQYANAATVTKELLRASKEAITHRYGNDVKAALAEAESMGITSPHEIHQLMAESRTGMSRRVWVRNGLKVWGAFFSLAEQFNRQATFIAAYRIAKAKEMSDGQAYDFSRKAVEETQGVYNKGNRPNWSRGRIGGVVMTFKQFSIMYLELIRRLPRKQKLIALGILMLAAGIQGLPFREDLEDIIDTIGQWLGFATHTDKAVKRAVLNAMGSEFGNFVLHGVSSIPGFPLDLQGRLGFSNLIPGTALLKPSEMNKGRELAQAFGPIGGVVEGAGKTMEGIVRGQGLGKAVHPIMPRSVQNALKGMEILETGTMTNQRGATVAKGLSPLDALVKSVGFNPEKIATKQRLMSTYYSDIEIQKTKEDEFSNRLARAIFNKDSKEKNSIIKEIQEWNRTNPEYKVAIEESQIKRRVIDMMQSQQEKFIKSTPKEMKREVYRGLRTGE